MPVIPFDADIMLQSQILLYVEVEERYGFAACLGDDEIIEGDVMRYYEIFLHGEHT
jgi:hypothetical protein